MSKRYTPSHEWISLHDNIARIGISAAAQKEVGEIVYVELPKIGYSVAAGSVVVVLESTKAAIDIYSPLSGKVVAINSELQTSTASINHSPEDQGWLYEIEISHPEELAALQEYS